MDEQIKLERGQVWYVNFNNAVGGEEAVGRPVVLVSTYLNVDTMSTIVGVWLTTTPKSGGTTVELFSPKKKSWAICNQITTIDKSRLLQQMCKLSESEMMKIDVALRKVLALPIKADGLEEEVAGLKAKIEVLNNEGAHIVQEFEVLKRSYDMLLNKYVEAKLYNDINKRGVKLLDEGEPPMEPIIIDIEEEPTPTPIAPEEIQKIVKRVNVGNPNVWHGKAKLAENAKVLNINMASKEDFMKIGIGEATAKNIVSYRRNKGQYNCKEDLLNVPRFGKGCMAVFGDYLEV